jgi:uncharacterized repeat protein (TIGR03803 family)
MAERSKPERRTVAGIGIRLYAALVTVALLAAVPAGAQVSYTAAADLWNSFHGIGAAGGVIRGSDGALYGIVPQGGPVGGERGLGGVYRIGADGTLTLLHEFMGPPNDIGPAVGALVEGTDGNFYGLAYGGNVDAVSLCGPGVIFKISPAGDVSIVHAMASLDPTLGAYPEGSVGMGLAACFGSVADYSQGLVRGTDGNFYGALPGGGLFGAGTMFKLTPAGVFSVVRQFPGALANEPRFFGAAGLTLGSDGNFYGAMLGGGTGLLFKVTPDGVFTHLHEFLAEPDGGSVAAKPVEGNDGNFYGFTYPNFGCGTFYRVTPLGAYTRLLSMRVDVAANGGISCPDGGSPGISPVTKGADGNFYGTATTGGEAYGTVLEITPAGSLTVLHTFSVAQALTEGYYPAGRLLEASPGVFYGTTSGFAGTVVFRQVVRSAGQMRSGVVTTAEGRPVSGTLGANATGGPPLLFSVAVPPVHGTVTVTDPATGAFTYEPTPGAIGYDPFTFTVSDGTTSSTATEMVFIVADSARWPGGAARASVAAGGTDATGISTDSSLSADGRFVVFSSVAPNLVVGDTNGTTDVFVLDRQTGQMTRVSVASGGAQSDGHSSRPSISADGRFVAFWSGATNLVPGDTNGALDVFVHDRQTGQTSRVSVASDGTQANGPSAPPRVSADGRFVAFSSTASNLVPGDANGVEDVFVHDLQTGQTMRISVASDGTEANGFNVEPAISADGRFVAFRGVASNLVADDTNGADDVFVHDRQTAETARVSVATGGAQSNGTSLAPAISADGRIVAFHSAASNLVAGDTSVNYDLFVHDRQTSETTRVSVSTDGVEANADSAWASLSADGRFVAFLSAASNLVADDTNGVEDVFVHDRVTGETTRVSVAGDGAQGNGDTDPPSLSADGRFVSFPSIASNLTPGDGNDTYDVFVVGGVSVSPRSASFGAAGGSGTADAAFVYAGTPWTATTSVPWISITGQSRPSSDGTVTYSVAPNTGVARTGALVVAGQRVLVSQAPRLNPLANDSTASTNEDTATAGILIATDPNGDPVTFSIVSNGAIGRAVITDTSTGAFTYTPNADASGTDVFTFKANDGTLDSNVATVTVTVEPVNDAPVAAIQALSTNQGTPVAGTLQASDVDSASLVFSIVGNGAKGTATVTNASTGSFTYTPLAGATGTDTFTFKANDGSLDSNVATVAVTIVPLAVTVVSPNGGERVFVNVPTAIRWTAAGATSFDVALSTNGGSTYTPINGCTGVPAAATSCNWTPAPLGTTTARVRVTAHGAGAGTAVDVSDGNFTISGTSPSITVVFPNSGVNWGIGSTETIAWTHNLGINTFVRIELSRNLGATWEVIASAVRNVGPAFGTYPWTVTGPATASALVRVTWVDGPATDVSNVRFSIAPPTITVTSPNTAVTWGIGTLHVIAFTHNLGPGQRFTISVSRDGGVTWTPLTTVAPLLPTTGSYAWAVTGPATSSARIRVAWVANGAVQDVSDVNFRIQ